MPKCPNCGKFMDEVQEDYEDMTDGQMADYEAGFGHTFHCSHCGNTDTFDANIDEMESPQFILDDKITAKTFEELIDRAIRNRCFIEVISLVHNVIENYLLYKLKINIMTNADKNIFTKIKEKTLDLELRTEIEEKIKILENKGGSNYLKYLSDYNELCYTLNLISKDLFDRIKDFNAKRNLAIHKLLTKGSASYSDIVSAAILGRKIQLELSPLNHSQKDIERIIKSYKKYPADSKDPFMINSGLLE